MSSKKVLKKMKKSVLSADISPRCIYCENGSTTANGQTVLCAKKGVMQPDSFCKKFRYDPLRRVPETVRLNTNFSPEDFSL